MVKVNRRNRRNLSIRIRHTGTWVLERLKLRELRNRAAFLLAISTFIDGDMKMYVQICSVFMLMVCRRRITIEQPIPRLIQRVDLRINDLEDDLCEIDYRFSKHHLLYLKEALRIPNFFHLDNGCLVHGEEALLVTLYRFSFSCRLVTMQQKFGREYSQICRIFNHTVKFVVENHGYRLHDLDFVRSRLPRFNEVIIRKAASFTNDGEVPETISKVSFFLDGTHNRIARPSGNENIQRSVYNGRKKIHSLAYQGVSGPDGIIYDL